MTVLAYAFGQLDQSDNWRNPPMLSGTSIIAQCWLSQHRNRGLVSAMIE
jgi:hypothetical protein